ncbi:MAG: HNH endonuclease [Mucilaginibacter sp.]
MNCIFCFENSDTSKSVEHIIPESLGNDRIILEKGYVCDKCNNYFSHTFEQQLLELPFFKEARHDLNIRSKKGKIPNGKGFVIDPELSEIEFHKDKQHKESFTFPMNAPLTKPVTAYTVVFNSPGQQNTYVSKFLGKMGIEALVYYALWYKESVEESVNQECFNNMKEYVRAGKKNQHWPYYERSLYSPEAGFQNPLTGEYYKVTSSFIFIYTENGQLLFQYLCMGTEFTIDLINQDIEEYKVWLIKNDNVSPVLKQVLSNKHL